MPYLWIPLSYTRLPPFHLQEPHPIVLLSTLWLQCPVPLRRTCSRTAQSQYHGIGLKGWGYKYHVPLLLPVQYPLYVVVYIFKAPDGAVNSQLRPVPILRARIWWMD